MIKRRNFSKVVSTKGYLFVQEREDNKKVYLVDQKDFDDPNKSGEVAISCIVLEYMETRNEYIYSIKYPETVVIIKRGNLEGMIFSD